LISSIILESEAINRLQYNNIFKLYLKLDEQSANLDTENYQDIRLN